MQEVKEAHVNHICSDSLKLDSSAGCYIRYRIKRTSYGLIVEQVFHELVGLNQVEGLVKPVLLYKQILIYDSPILAIISLKFGTLPFIKLLLGFFALEVWEQLRVIWDRHKLKASHSISSIA